MSSRDPDERHRSSSPLELFFDLTFVVAVSEAGSGLQRGLAGGRAEPWSTATASPAPVAATLAKKRPGHHAWFSVAVLFRSAPHSVAKGADAAMT
jgi:hypothetical protein